jgi:GTPase
MSGMTHRCGHVAIVGRPNVGKSTLLNRLVGQKISITSRKPQTTRQRITGILTGQESQIVFVDTPGFQTRHASALNRMMNRSVTRGLQEVDVVVWVIEALKLNDQDLALHRLMPASKPLVIAVNKIDRLRNRNLLLPFLEDLYRRVGCTTIVPVSAQGGQGLDDLVKVIVPLLPEAERLYAEDEITVLSERFLAAELIREKLFRLLGNELPYSAAVDIAGFEMRGALRRVRADIIVDRQSQKPIVIGAGGEKLKTVATQARKDMEALFGGKVFLEVNVKVRSGWSDNESALRRLGYG